MSITVSDKMKNMKPSAIREIFKSLGTPGAISFAAGNPAPESFPVEAMGKIAANIFQQEAVGALQYSVTEGYPALRQLMTKRLKERFGIGSEEDMTIITSGGQQAIELSCKVLCNEGDTVICENPSFIGALNAFRSLGARTVGVELEDDGICIESLEQTIKANPRAKILYVIPTFHNPAGITMSLAKRRAVYELARRYDLVILEDNPYGDLRFAAAAILGYIIAAVTFVVFPTRILGREEVTASGLTGLLIRITFAADTPQNLFPSVHVFVSVLCLLTALGTGGLWLLVCLLMYLGVCISTLVLRQHYLPDVWGGTLLALVTWQLAKLPVLQAAAQVWTDLFLNLL